MFWIFCSPIYSLYGMAALDVLQFGAKFGEIWELSTLIYFGGGGAFGNRRSSTHFGELHPHHDVYSFSWAQTPLV